MQPAISNKDYLTVIVCTSTTC